MELRYAHLADFASADAAGKVTIVGAFDIVWDQMKKRPIPFPPCYFVASFAASIAEGSAHKMRIEFADADENPVMDPIQADVKFQPFGPGYPLRAQVILGFGPETVRVPDLGDYHFSVLVDNKELGRVAVSVLEPPPSK